MVEREEFAQGNRKAAEGAEDMEKAEKQDILRYLAALIATLVAMTVIVGYTFYSFYSLAKEDVIALGEVTAKERTQALDNYLLRGHETLDVTIEGVEYLLGQGASAKKIEQFLKKESDNYANRVNSNFTGIYGLVQGEFVDGSGWVPDEGFVPQERTWYERAVKGQVTMVPPYIDAQTGDVVVSITRMLSDGKSVLAMDISLDEIQVMAEDMNLKGHGYGFVMDDTGFVVAHTDKTHCGANYYMDDLSDGGDREALAKKVITEKDKSFKMEIDDEHCTIFTSTLRDDWYVVMVVRTDDLFSRMRTNLYHNIGLSMIIFVVVAYFCTTSFFNRLKATHYAEELEIHQRLLEERVAEQTTEIKKQTTAILRMQEDVIEGMATLIESRDGNTGEHVRNTKKYVALIVNHMLQHQLHTDIVTKEYADKLINAASLHDVGKIKISDTILNKPGRLTEEEYEIMKTHSSEGSEIVQIILGTHTDKKFVEIAQDVVRYHHEKWDGNGYPEGLKGPNIPLASRIMAVADVFDALVSKRVYKDKISEEEAFGILVEESGTHFDPEIVKIFLRYRDTISGWLSEQE